MTHTLVNLEEKTVSTLPSDYKWHLNYWYNDLDLKIHERCVEGVHYWTEYSNVHNRVFQGKKNLDMLKLDICTKIQCGYEIFSISMLKPRELLNTTNVFKLKAAVCHYASKSRKSWKASTHLPLRKQLQTSTSLPPQKKIKNLYEYPCFFFNGIVFTLKEMQTIRSLLELKTIKEIAAYHHCTPTAEKQRINRIRQKLNCEHFPFSRLFTVLKEKGILAACMDTYLE